MFVRDSAAHLDRFGRHAGAHGGAGYPMPRLVAVVACGTRTILGAVFGPYRAGELSYAPRLLGCLRPGMLLLADRNFAVAGLVNQIASTGADLLIRCKNGRRLPPTGHLPDGSWLTRCGPLTLRVPGAEITATLGSRTCHTGRYRLVTTLPGHRRHPAIELVKLYHQRWEIETAYLELKSTILGGRVLRDRTPAGIDQEVYALLVTYQVLRTAMTDATNSQPD